MMRTTSPCHPEILGDARGRLRRWIRTTGVLERRSLRDENASTPATRSLAASPRWRPLCLAAAAALAILLAACGDAELAQAPAPDLATPADPLTTIPREELYGASPVDNLWSPRIELEVDSLPAAWDSARFAIISDFQLGLWAGNEQVAAAAVQRAVDAQPDVIVLLGDYLAEGEDPAMLQRILEPLRGRTVVAVLGDRDLRSDTVAARVTRTLQAAGAIVLRNSSVGLEREGQLIHITGVSPALVGLPAAQQDSVFRSFAASGPTPILLSHAAEAALRVPVGRYPVILAGNTACTELAVPGTPPLANLVRNVFAEGRIGDSTRLFEARGSLVVVSCGVGFGFLPMRFAAAPEVPILALRRSGAQADSATMVARG
jgi:predicted MPP superfamily phosphohydrolase